MSTTTINRLAIEIVRKANSLPVASKYWIGLAGPPGSGKSTLADHLQRAVGELLTVIPMDGYHLRRSELDAMDNPDEAHARRGAPFSFAADRFVRDLLQARNTNRGSFPGFDHVVGDPISDEILLIPDAGRVVLVEGNYLLLNDEPWCRLRHSVFDETWFLNVDVETCRRRVLRRHLATGLSVTEAQERVKENDGPNAELVIRHSKLNADRIIELMNSDDDTSPNDAAVDGL